MSYTAKNIRNVALLGHGGDGKTMLAEDMLFMTGGTDRLGSIADGNTVSDFDPEEIKRQNSISTSLIPVEFEGCKINLLDNPGVFDFAGEIVQSLRVADAGIIVLTAKSGIAVGTEKAWKAMKDCGKPTMFYISKMDEENANFFGTVEAESNCFISFISAVDECLCNCQRNRNPLCIIILGVEVSIHMGEDKDCFICCTRDFTPDVMGSSI